MTNKLFAVLALTLLTNLNCPLTNARAQGTAFAYQGRLNTSGNPAGGLYDFRFKLYADPLGNTQVGASYLTNAVPVANGLFLTTIDFGAGIFTGSNFWLEVNVKTNAGASYAVLSPLQSVLPAPYAVFAGVAGNVSGTVSSANIAGNYGNAVTLNNAGNNFSGSYSGNGANVTNVNAATLNGLSGASFWQLGGNNVAAGGFLGSTNNQPVEVWVNNQRLLRMSYAANSLNGYSPNFLAGFAGNNIGSGVCGATICGGGGTNTYIYGRLTNGSVLSLAGPHSGTNAVLADFGTVVGGSGNVASGAGAVAMGLYSTASGYGSLAMGLDCLANNYGSVAMGGQSSSSGSGSTAMGVFSTASGDFSLAAGLFAQALHQGAFVWADSQETAFSSTASDQFCIRAQGGVQLDPGTSLYFGSQTRQMINLFGASYGIGVQGGTTYQRSGAGFAWFKGGVHSDTQNDPGTGGTVLMTLATSGLTVNGTFVNTSDRNAKENFAPVNAREVLAKVAALPITKWIYKTDTGTPHIGPMAQDFYAAFDIGPDDKHITTVDEGGVALAAIQGLNQKVEEKDAEIQALKQSVDELKKLVQSLVEKK